VETSSDAIRGREHDGLYVLGLVSELRDLIKEYSADVVIMIGSSVPFSKILSVSSRFGVMTPEFKLVPELKSEGGNDSIMLIDIHPGGIIGASRR
jgi:hypothetical protein